MNRFDQEIAELAARVDFVCLYCIILHVIITFQYLFLSIFIERRVMFKKILFIGLLTITGLTQSEVYGQESNPTENDKTASEELIASKITSDIEKFIANLELQGYSKDQILEQLKTKIESDRSHWPKVADHCIRSATIVALAAITAWWINKCCSAYVTYKNNEVFDRRMRDLWGDKEDRTFPGREWR